MGSPALSVLQGQYQRAIESIGDLIANYVDPDDAFVDPVTGERYVEIGGGDSKYRTPFTSEESLATIRKMCRQLAMTNEFAINGHENRINYIVGSGHGYSAVAKDGVDLSEERLTEAQTIIDEFIRVNKWSKRQQEIVRRKDRDGEVFLRLFSGIDGVTKVRFIEPDQVYTPNNRRNDKNASFGILTEDDDVETVLAYFVDGQAVDASEIQHRKGNVDCNVKRGVPLFYPVYKNLGRAERLLRNMSVVAEIQAAIAMIRKRTGATSSTVQDMVANTADQTITNTNATHSTRYFRHYAPGTIIDSNQSMEYEFPSMKVNPGAYVPVLQAILRAIASRLVMPEFMLTSDASNANYASTMVAEGPAYKQLQRLQWDAIEDDLEVFDKVLDAAVASGRLSQELRDVIEIDVEPPRFETQDRNMEVQADVALVREKIMSRHTAQLRHDLDPEKEDVWIDEDREKNDPFAGLMGNPFMGQNDYQKDKDQDQEENGDKPDRKDSDA